MSEVKKRFHETIPVILLANPPVVNDLLPRMVPENCRILQNSSFYNLLNFGGSSVSE